MNFAARRTVTFTVTLAILALGAAPASATPGRSWVSPQVALDWNLNAVTAVRASTPTKLQAEGIVYMAYAQAAVYDAATKIAGRYVLYHDFTASTAGASVDAAVIAAAYNTLVAYLPDQGPALLVKYNAAIAAVPDAGKSAGIAVGAAAAADIVALRTGDGRNGPYDHTVGAARTYTTANAGEWEIEPPSTTAATPWLGSMKPFLLESAAQFRAPPPPALESDLYARDFDEVKTMGAKTGSARTDDQTNVAYFWTYNVINQENQDLRDVAIQHHMDLLDTVRLLAMGNMVGADAGIACWDSKYHYLFWRPETAIHHADVDGNANTAADASWAPLLPTPNHPDYTSGHGCVSPAFALAVAKALHTKRIDMDVVGLTPSGSLTTRHFATVKDLEADLVNARVWVGFHFRNSVEQGVVIATHVARWTLARYFHRAGNEDETGDDAED